MTPQQAIHILMLSPCYWRLNLSARKQLVREYCASYEAVPQVQARERKKDR